MLKHLGNFHGYPLKLLFGDHFYINVLSVGSGGGGRAISNVVK